jgi:site-specific DNA recombinase
MRSSRAQSLTPGNWQSANAARVRQINMTLSLAFLAPALVKAAVEGRLSLGINIERLRDPDPIWAKQFHDLGLNPN